MHPLVRLKRLFNKLSSCQRFETPWRLWDVTVIIILQHAALNTWTAPLEAVIVVSSAVTSDQTVKIILMKRIAVSTSFYKFHASTTSLSRLQERRLLRESLEMEKLFHPTLYNGCDFLSMVGLKLTHVSKTGPWLYINRWFLSSTFFFILTIATTQWSIWRTQQVVLRWRTYFLFEVIVLFPIPFVSCSTRLRLWRWFVRFQNKQWLYLPLGCGGPPCWFQQDRLVNNPYHAERRVETQIRFFFHLTPFIVIELA